jgi:hypothetical protein
VNANTIEQARELKELGVREDYCSEGCCSGYEWWIKTPGLGPALTLDDLHKVFLLDSIVGAFQWPAPIFKFEDKSDWWWVKYYNGNILHKFPRTKNHAEDWTSILIYLLKENHITAEQVNKALGE